MTRPVGEWVGILVLAGLAMGYSGEGRTEPPVVSGREATLAAVATSSSRETPSPDDAEIDRILRSRYVEVEKVRLVLLPARVEDKKGRSVLGLTPSDFRLTEDQVPQRIDYFSEESENPISLAFLLDVSGSMRLVGKLDAAKESIRYFVEQLQPRDRFALIAFADDQVAWVTDFTSDRDGFLTRLSVQTGYGQTALNDAIAAAPGLVQASTDGRKAIVLITDGVDNASRLTLDQAVDLARKASVPIYSIGFSSLPQGLLRESDERTNLEVLDKLSHETGGDLFVVHDPDELKEAVATVNEELRHQYVIGYKPSRTEWDGAFRRVRLETPKAKLIVRTRTGYYATP